MGAEVGCSAIIGLGGRRAAQSGHCDVSQRSKYSQANRNQAPQLGFLRVIHCSRQVAAGPLPVDLGCENNGRNACGQAATDGCQNGHDQVVVRFFPCGHMGWRRWSLRKLRGDVVHGKTSEGVRHYARGFMLFCKHLDARSNLQLKCRFAGWSSLAARRVHTPKVGGSNPPPATKIHAAPRGGFFLGAGGWLGEYPITR